MRWDHRSALFSWICLMGWLACPVHAESDSPQVKIISPSPKSFVSGSVPIEMEVVGASAPVQLTLLRDGAVWKTLDGPPYRFEWDTSSELEGPHSLQAKLADSLGREAASGPMNVTVDNTPPEMRLLDPVPQMVWVGIVSIEAQVSDVIGLAEVRFLIDGVAQGSAKEAPFRFRWDTTGIPNGVHSVQIRAVDRAGNSTTTSGVAVRTANKNHPPLLNPVDRKRVVERKTLSFTVSAFDPDGARDPITYRAYDLPPWASFNPETGEFRASPDASAATTQEPKKEYVVRFQACDPEPLCAALEVPIEVENANQPPTLPEMKDYRVREGEAVSIQFSAAADPDEDELVYQAQPLPGWLKFDPAGRIFHGTPDYDIASQQRPEENYTLTVKACDPEPLCDQKNFTITVTNKNRRPVLKSVSDKTIEEGKTFAIPLEASDPDGDPLKMRVTALPQGAGFKDNGSGKAVLLWASRTDQAGRYPFTFTVSDGELEDGLQVIVTLSEESLCISGVIRDAINTPFPGATVKCVGPGQTARYAVTDDSGYYLFQDLRPGPWTLKADYEPADKFSSTPRSSQGTYHFHPLSRRVELNRSDVTEINFTALAD